MVMEVAGAPIWSLEQVSERMEESTKRIVDNLQRNLEKIFDDVFSPIFSSMKLELKEMEEELEDEENQADLMEEEEVPETIFTGEELQSATISIGEEMSRCEQNFCSIISSFSGGVMVEKLGGGCRGGAGGSRGEFAGGFTGGGVPFASGVSSDFESSGLRNKAGGFVGGLYGGICERGGAGCCGSGGGPGGADFLGDPGNFVGAIGCEFEGLVRKLKYGGRLGDSAGGFTGGVQGELVGNRAGGYCGLAGDVHSGFEEVFAGKVEQGGMSTAGGGLNRDGDFSSGFTGGGKMVRGGLGFLTGGETDGGKIQWRWFHGGFQKYLEREVNRRCLDDSGVSWERKIVEGASKGIIVIIHLQEIASDFSKSSRASNNTDCYSRYLRLNGLSHFQPNLSYFVVTCTLNSSGFGLVSFRPIYLTSVLKSKVITQIVHCNFPYPQPTHPKSTKTNSTQNSMISHTMLVHYSDFSATSDHCCQGRESSSDYKPP